MYRIRSTAEVKSQREIQALHPNTSIPKIWTSAICDSLGIDPIMKTPKPALSTITKRIISSAPVQDTLNNWVEAWTEVDMFSDIPDGQTKAEQETAYIAKDLSDRKTKKLQDLATIRYEKEIAGITLPSGGIIATDRPTQSMLDSASRRASIDPTLTVRWKGKNGFVNLTAPEIIAIGDLVFAHVQSCFAREAELTEAIMVDVKTDISTGWS